MDVPTRWNSTYVLLESIERNYEKVYEILIEMKQEKLAARIDRSHLQKLIEFLKPFYHLTKKFSSQIVETIGDVWPTVARLSEFLYSRGPTNLELESDEDASNFSDLEIIKSNMINGLTSTVGRRHMRLTITNIHKISSVLDPRLKSLAFAPAEERKMVYEKLLTEMQSIVDKQKEKSQPFNVDDQPSTSSASSNIVTYFNIDLFYNLGSSNAGADKSKIDVKRELDSYLNGNFSIGYSKDTIMAADFPLIFWREKGQQYPILRLMAQKYLGIPATSVPSEQIFSQAGRVLTDRRSMMSGKTLEMSVFLKKNFNKLG